MKFNEIIKSKFGSSLESHGFKIDYEGQDVLDFASDTLTIRFYHNNREGSSGYFLKHKDFKDSYESWLVELFLGIKYEPVFGLTTQEEKIALWANERSAYFISNTKDFLNSPKDLFKQLNDFFEKRNQEYNKKFK